MRNKNEESGFEVNIVKRIKKVQKIKSLKGNSRR
jgi:hypothetical protein